MGRGPKKPAQQAKAVEPPKQQQPKNDAARTAQKQEKTVPQATTQKPEPATEPVKVDDLVDSEKLQSEPLRPPPEGSSFGNTLGILATMKKEFKELEESLLFMHDQASNRALLNGQDVEKELRAIQKQVQDVEKRMKDGLEEIELLFNKVKDKTLKEELRQHVLAIYGEMIDQAVREQVAECLAKEAPQELQEEVARTKTELDEAQRQLHNAQSQAANELLRENDNEKMHTIYMTNGLIHEKFPKTLKELFGLDVPTIRELLVSYEIPGISESKQMNHNLFIQFCGVQYTMDDDDQVKLAQPVDRAQGAQGDNGR